MGNPFQRQRSLAQEQFQTLIVLKEGGIKHFQKSSRMSVRQVNQNRLNRMREWRASVQVTLLSCRKFTTLGISRHREFLEQVSAML